MVFFQRTHTVIKTKYTDVDSVSTIEENFFQNDCHFRGRGQY